MWGDSVNGFEEDFGRHVGCVGNRATIATAVFAVKVATQGALPKERIEPMGSNPLAIEIRKETQSDALA